MKKRSSIYLFVVVLMLFSYNENSAQTSSKKRHSLSQTERSLFDQASMLSEEGVYSESSRLWKQLVDIYPVCGNYRYHYAVAILNAGEPHTIVDAYLSQAISDSGTLIRGSGKYNEDLCSAPIDVLVYAAEIKRLQNKFDAAQDLIIQFKSEAKNNNPVHLKADKILRDISFAQSLMSNPIDVTVNNLGDAVNSEYDETHPCVRADELQLFFTSNRGRSNGSNHGKFDPNSLKHYGDIYVSERDSSWGEAEWVNIGLTKHKYAIAISPFGADISIAHVDGWSTESYTANKRKGEWLMAVNIEGASPMPSEGVTVFSPNRDFAVMSIVDVRGKTGSDLYYYNKLADGSWSNPEKIKGGINSNKDEITPFISADGSLFFASNGHDGLGGFDCYKSNFIDGYWSVPKNLGYPINTVDDDSHIAISADGTRAYISSRRNRPLGDYDIFEIEFTDESRLVNNNILLLNSLVSEQIDALDIKCMETGEVYDPGTFEDGDLFARSILYGGYSYELRYYLNGIVIKTDVIEITEDAGYHSYIKPINAKGGWISNGEKLLIEKYIAPEPIADDVSIVTDSMELALLLGGGLELDNWNVFYDLTPQQIHTGKIDISAMCHEVITRIESGLFPELFISSSASKSENRSTKETHDFSGKRSANIYMRLKAMLSVKGYTNSVDYSFLPFEINVASNEQEEVPDFVRIEIK